MKKILIIAFALTLALSLAACGGSESDTSLASENEANTSESTSLAETTNNDDSSAKDGETIGEVSEFLAHYGLTADGKTYRNFSSLDEESTLEALYENPLWEKFPGTMWAYPYKMPKGDTKINVSTSYDYETGIYKMSISVFGG